MTSVGRLAAAAGSQFLTKRREVLSGLLMAGAAQHFIQNREKLALIRDADMGPENRQVSPQITDGLEPVRFSQFGPVRESGQKTQRDRRVGAHDDEPVPARHRAL